MVRIREAVLRGMAACALATAIAEPAAALLPQSWNGYRWARTGNLAIKLGDNVTRAWDPYLRLAASAWSDDPVIDFVVGAGATARSTCAPVFGTVQACNYNYGATGWLGYAQVWTSGSYIVQATVKLNDYYFSQSRYNNAGYRTQVACQEVGHTLGLAHADTNSGNTNLGTCMDYTNDPTGTAGTNGTLANMQPSATDFYNLGNIYANLDSTQLASTKITTVAGDGFNIEGEHHDDHDHDGAVPEPSAWALMILGFGLIGAAMRRQAPRGLVRG